MTPRQRVFAILGGASAIILVAWFGIANASPTDTATDAGTLCKAAQGTGNHLTAAQKTWAQQCVAVFAEGKRLYTPPPTPSPSASPSASPSPSPSVSPSATPTPSPTETVTPSPSQSQSTPPAGFPDASNTGVPAGTVLTNHAGDWTINTANTVIDAMNITGCVTVNAPGVTITRSHIHASCAAPVVSHFGTNGSPVHAGDAPLTVSDSEIDCNFGAGTAVGDTNITLLRVNIHGCENGGDFDGHISVQDSFVHDLWADAACVTAHTDGFQMPGEGGFLTINHNAIDPQACATSAIISPQASSGIHDVTISNNLLGGGAYTLYCAQNGPGVNFQVLSNRFKRDYTYGPMTDCADETISGNVWDDTGLPVPPA